jgi:hypothetical protein
LQRTRLRSGRHPIGRFAKLKPGSTERSARRTSQNIGRARTNAVPPNAGSVTVVVEDPSFGPTTFRSGRHGAPTGRQRAVSDGHRQPPPTARGRGSGDSDGRWAPASAGPLDPSRGGIGKGCSSAPRPLRLLPKLLPDGLKSGRSGRHCVTRQFANPQVRGTIQHRLASIPTPLNGVQVPPRPRVCAGLAGVRDRPSRRSYSRPQQPGPGGVRHARPRTRRGIVLPDADTQHRRGPPGPRD